MRKRSTLSVIFKAAATMGVGAASSIGFKLSLAALVSTPVAPAVIIAGAAIFSALAITALKRSFDVSAYNKTAEPENRARFFEISKTGHSHSYYLTSFGISTIFAGVGGFLALNICDWIADLRSPDLPAPNIPIIDIPAHIEPITIEPAAIDPQVISPIDTADFPSQAPVLPEITPPVSPELVIDNPIRPEVQTELPTLMPIEELSQPLAEQAITPEAGIILQPTEPAELATQIQPAPPELTQIEIVQPPEIEIVIDTTEIAPVELTENIDAPDIPSAVDQLYETTSVNLPETAIDPRPEINSAPLLQTPEAEPNIVIDTTPPPSALEEALALVPEDANATLCATIARLESTNIDVRAQAIKDLGYFIANGFNGFTEDDFLANRLFSSVADINAQAAHDLGYHLLHGIGIEADYERAYDLLTQAHENGSTLAAEKLEYMNAMGLTPA